MIKQSFSTLRLYPKRLNSTSTVVQPDINLKQEKAPKVFDTATISPQQYLSSRSIIPNLKDRIPPTIIKKKKLIECLYLIDPSVARKIATEISPFLRKCTERVIAECTPGLGLLTRQLLKRSIGPITLFEPSRQFRDGLKKLAASHPKSIRLYSKNLFKLSSYQNLDRLDRGNREEKLLESVPKKGWGEDPAISIIGPVINTNFLRYVINSIAKQTSLAEYGRVEMFLIMKPSRYLVISSEYDFYAPGVDKLKILFNLFFDYELLCKLPREAFLPWDRASNSTHPRKVMKIDKNMLYLVHIVAKKDLPLPLDQLVPFQFFIRKCYKRNARIIPVLECLVPDSGKHIIIPQLQHEEPLSEIDIYTEFKQLTPKQLIAVFREMHNHSNYTGSSFAEMLEAYQIKSERVEGLNYIPGPENTLLEEIDEELDIHDNITETFDKNKLSNK